VQVNLQFWGHGFCGYGCSVEFCWPTRNRTHSRGVTGCQSSCAFSHKTSFFWRITWTTYKEKNIHTILNTSGFFLFCPIYSIFNFSVPLCCSCVLHNQFALLFLATALLLLDFLILDFLLPQQLGTIVMGWKIRLDHCKCNACWVPDTEGPVTRLRPKKVCQRYVSGLINIIVN